MEQKMVHSEKWVVGKEGHVVKREGDVWFLQ
jgi:hypothetical protein